MIAQNHPEVSSRQYMIFILFHCGNPNDLTGLLLALVQSKAHLARPTFRLKFIVTVESR